MFACMYMHHVCGSYPLRPEEGIRSYESWVTVCCYDLPFGCWETNLGTLQEHQVFLITELPLRHKIQGSWLVNGGRRDQKKWELNVLFSLYLCAIFKRVSIIVCMYAHRILYAYLLQNDIHILTTHTSKQQYSYLSFLCNFNVIYNYLLHRPVTVQIRWVSTTFTINFLANANEWRTADVEIAIQLEAIFPTNYWEFHTFLATV